MPKCVDDVKNKGIFRWNKILMTLKLFIWKWFEVSSEEMKHCKKDSYCVEKIEFQDKAF